MIVEDYTSFPLPFDPSFMRNGNNGVFMIASSYGEIAIFNQKGVTLYTVRIPNLIKEEEYIGTWLLKDIDFCHRSQKIAFITPNKLYLVSYLGEILHEEKGRYESIHYRDEGIWGLKLKNQNQVFLQLYDPISFKIISSLKLNEYKIHQIMEFNFQDIGNDSTFLLRAGNIDEVILFLIAYEANREIRIKNISLNWNNNIFINSSISCIGNTDIENEYEQQIRVYAYPKGRLIASHKITIPADHGANWIFWSPIFLSEDKFLFFDLEQQLFQIFDIQSGSCIPFIIKDHICGYPENRDQNRWVIEINSLPDTPRILWMKKSGNTLVLRCENYSHSSNQFIICVTLIQLDKLSFPRFPEQLSLF